MYDSDDAKAQQTAAAAANLYIHSNALSPLAFPSLRKMEVESVAMTLALLNADDKACGTLTSGGTESLMCAVKSYRDRARDLWPHITQPEMVTHTPHPPFLSRCIPSSLPHSIAPLHVCVCERVSAGVAGVGSPGAAQSGSPLRRQMCMAVRRCALCCADVSCALCLNTRSVLCCAVACGGA